MNKGKGSKKVLFVLTSNNVKGATGIPTGFNLSEVTHPLEKLEESGVVVDIASIKGGEAPLMGEVLTQLAFYAGWPKLISSSLVVREVYDGQNK